MRSFLIVCVCCVWGASGQTLWPRGVVHYSINPQDYDQHSRSEILATISQLQREFCVKFFYVQSNATAKGGRILHVTNPEKRIGCPPDSYNFDGAAVDLTIGYECLNKKDIARIFVDMLKASIGKSPPVNSIDLEKKFQDQKVDTSSALVSDEDRNFINTHYHKECANLNSVPPLPLGARRSGSEAAPGLSSNNEHYYGERVWPLGMIMYDFSDSMPIQHANPKGALSGALASLMASMVEIMRKSCIVFKKVDLKRDYLVPKNYILFTDDAGNDGVPHLGIIANQSLNVLKFAAESPSFVSHTLNNLLRVAGVPMMSNRYDRDYYVTVHWDNIQSGKEYLLEKAPEDAWIRSIPYDFLSATHAPPDYMLDPSLPKPRMSVSLQQESVPRDLALRARTKGALTASDVEALKLIYSKECEKRERFDLEPSSYQKNKEKEVEDHKSTEEPRQDQDENPHSTEESRGRQSLEESLQDKEEVHHSAEEPLQDIEEVRHSAEEQENTGLGNNDAKSEEVPLIQEEDLVAISD